MANRAGAPTTPQPFADGEAQLPPAPRHRLRLKRRNARNFSAPTQQFLASVAAADVPIPSIEEPEIVLPEADMDDAHSSLLPYQVNHANLLALHDRTFSPPKTPAPDTVPTLLPSQYPDWSLDTAYSSSTESSPEPDDVSSRPSTSRSTMTSASLFSRFSHWSDEACISPEASGDFSFENGRDISAATRTVYDALTKSRKAPWTQAMSSHLWSTYTLYLQDPKVTPFRMGKSCIPPPGVCLRVAREAKRSWKGSKAQKSTNVADTEKSGSTTPTAEIDGTFIQWPHTCAATRAHLRELCKLKVANPGARCGAGKSPTPFKQAANRRWNRRITPTPATAAFTTHDMTISLSMTTSQALQPEGPLAQLTSSSPISTNTNSFTTVAEARNPSSLEGESSPSPSERRRLGSPFMAQSYGPSSSTSLATVLGLPSPRQPHTIGARRTLQPPVRLSRSSTQKRRSTQAQDARKRPNLDSDVFDDPSTELDSRQPNRDAAFSSTSSRMQDSLFIPRIEAEPVLRGSSSHGPQTGGLLQSALAPARLGSPFSVQSTSFSFPNRLTQPQGFDASDAARPFASAQRKVDPTPIPARTNLASRLAYIDRRLKEFNRGRSKSPSREP